MAQPTGGLRLAEEARDAPGVEDRVGAHELQREVAIGGLVARAPHDAHRPRPEQADQAIAAPDDVAGLERTHAGILARPTLRRELTASHPSRKGADSKSHPSLRNETHRS